MAKQKLFIGSSQANIAVARLVANRLESDGSAEGTVWNEGVFSLNKGFLEKLLALLSEFDFAVLIWAPDDITESKGESKASPRDNVIFECGLFMGAVGRDRVFIVCDQSVSLKIPSDLAGITLATYDGARTGGEDAEAAVRMACDQISREIQKPRFPTIVGEWVSRYPLTEDPGNAEVIEDVEIKAARGGVSIASKQNAAGDFYIAYGRILFQNQIMGEWRAKLGSGDGKGVFVLTMNPRGNVMYGYNTAPNVNNAVVYTTWVLAKRDGADEKKIKERLRWAESQLKEMTVSLPLPAAD
jgi:hypothetical protein